MHFGNKDIAMGLTQVIAQFYVHLVLQETVLHLGVTLSNQRATLLAEYS